MYESIIIIVLVGIAGIYSSYHSKVTGLSEGVLALIGEDDHTYKFMKDRGMLPPIKCFIVMHDKKTVSFFRHDDAFNYIKAQFGDGVHFQTQFENCEFTYTYGPLTLKMRESDFVL